MTYFANSIGVDSVIFLYDEINSGNSQIIINDFEMVNCKINFAFWFIK